MSLPLLGVGSGAGAASADFPIAQASATSAFSAIRKLWAAASSTLYSTTGSLVDSAADQTGNGRIYAASGTQRPTLATGVGPNSVAAFQFGGAQNLIGSAISSLITNSAGYICASFMPTAFTNNDALSYRNDCVFEDSGAFIAMTLRTAGIAYGYNWDGNEDKAASGSSFISLSTPYVAEWRHESGTVYLRVRAGGTSTEFSAASGNTSTMTGTLDFGGVPGATPSRFLTGYIFEAMTASAVPSLATRDLALASLAAQVGA